MSLMWRDDPGIRAGADAGHRRRGAARFHRPRLRTEVRRHPCDSGHRTPRSRGSGGASPPIVRFWSRLGNDKTAQFPEVAAALRQWGRRLKRPVVLDGEIVALDARGNPVGFQYLQGRIHLKYLPRSRVVETPTHRAGEAATAFVAFDILRDGSDDLRSLPLRERRPRLEALLGRVRDPRLRISEQVVGDGRALHARAKAKGWEGLIAKRLDSVYTSGRRSPDWAEAQTGAPADVRHRRMDRPARIATLFRRPAARRLR